MVFGVVMKMPEYDRNKLTEVVKAHVELCGKLNDKSLTEEERASIMKRIKELIDERDRMLSINYQ